MEDLTGQQFGPYQIVEALGEGGMSAIYKAFQPGVERYVAVKVLPRQLAAEPEYMGRFRQEARVLASLQHPHILPVFDFGESKGYTYFVMPFVGTGTLGQRMAGKPIDMAKINRVISQVGDALDYAHGRGLVHRDIKPNNILIDARDNALLTDFGIAKLYESTSVVTSTGGILGTPAYMSPEQGSGKQVDGRSDIYSLGVVLYEMATGRVPFTAETPIAVVFKHIQDPLPPPKTYNPALSPAVENVILKSLAKRPEDRFQTAGALVQALDDALFETEFDPFMISEEQLLKLMAAEKAGAGAPKTTAKKKQKGFPRWVLAVVGIVLILGLASALCLWAIFGDLLPITSPPGEEEKPFIEGSPVPTTPAEVPGSATLIPPAPTATRTPAPEPPPEAGEPCAIGPNEQVIVGPGTKLWTEPDAQRAIGSTTLEPGTVFYALGDPVWGYVNAFSEEQGWWWEVSRQPGGGSSGWIWEDQLYKCR